MEAMADIATVFHWPLSELSELQVEDLDRWHALALRRFRATRGG